MSPLFEQLSDEFKGTSLAVAELGVKLEWSGRDFGELTTFVLENIRVAEQLHEDLKNLHVEQKVESRVTNLEQWGNDLATANLNDC